MTWGWVQLATKGQDGALTALRGPEESPLPVRALDLTKTVKSVLLVGEVFTLGMGVHTWGGLLKWNSQEK